MYNKVSRVSALFTLFFLIIRNKYGINNKETAISISTNSSTEHSCSMAITLKNLFCTSTIFTNNRS